MKIENFVNRILTRAFGKTPEGDHRVWWHVQNLNVDREDQPKGSMLVEGRGWLNFQHPLNPRRHASFHISWSLRSSFAHLKFGLEESEQAVEASVALPPVALWLSLEGLFPLRETRDLSLSVHDWHLWWNVWRDDNSWDRSVPRWRHGSWDILTTFLGKQDYKSTVLQEREVLIPMPEGGYPAHIKLTKDIWRRPRWKPDVVYRANITMKTPIPHEGKGENSYDCGKDALHGMTTPAKTLEQAVAKVVESVLRSRRKYDGDPMARYPAPQAAEGT